MDRHVGARPRHYRRALRAASSPIGTSGIWLMAEGSGLTGDFDPGRSGADAVTMAHQADAVEFRLLVRIVGRALAHLVALIEQLDLLQLLEGFAEHSARVVELPFELLGRALEV